MSIGSVVTMPSSGRVGFVTTATTVGKSADGDDLVSLRVRQRVPAAEADGRGVPTAPTPAEAAAARRGDEPARGPATAYEVRDPAVAREGVDLTAAERDAVTRLRQRDAQVRQEENAHAGVAGDAAGPISYTYAVGPDGRQYAVGGSVSVRIANPSGDPAQLASAANRLAAAAHAAHNPSAADLAAAAKGYRVAATAGRGEPAAVDRAA